MTLSSLLENWIYSNVPRKGRGEVPNEKNVAFVIDLTSLSPMTKLISLNILHHAVALSLFV